MKIKKIKINGYKNIKDTELDFDKTPIIVLLAPNNYGKSNLLEAIQMGFDLIAKQGTQVPEYIENGENYANFNINDGKLCKFEFSVEFEKAINAKTYEYSFSLDYSVEKNQSGKVKIYTQGVSHEELKSISKEENGGKWRRMFVRTVLDEFNKPLDVHKLTLYDVNDDPGTKYIIPIIERLGERHYKSSSFLGLHKLGGVAMLAERTPGDKTADILRDITGVLISLTREIIGNIVMGETSDFHDLENLFENVGKMKQTDDELEKERQHTENPIDREKHPGEWGFFKEEFQTLFPCYRTDIEAKKVEENKEAWDNDEDLPHSYVTEIANNDSESGIKLQVLGNSGKYQILFENKRKIRQETAKSLSFGTRRVFKMLSQAISNKSPLFFIEGIENGLHPELYQGLIRSLNNAVDDALYEDKTCIKRPHNPCLIISSHAPGIVAAFEGNPESIYVPLLDKKNEGVAQFESLSADIKSQLLDEEYVDFFDIGEAVFELLLDKDTQECNKKLIGKGKGDC